MMNTSEQEFLKRLKETFRTEADEHLRAISAGLFELEKTVSSEGRIEIVEEIFRRSHSLKGAARAVNLQDVESICQSLESVLARAKRGEIELTPDLSELFHETVEALNRLILNLEEDPSGAERTRIRELKRQLNKVRQPASLPASLSLTSQLVPTIPPTPPSPQTGTTGGSPSQVDPQEVAAPPSARPAPKAIPAESVRIPISKLDPLLLQAEEMIQAKLAATQRALELREMLHELRTWREEWAKWKERGHSSGIGSGIGSGVAADGSVHLASQVGPRLDGLIDKMVGISQTFEQDRRVLGHMVDEHLNATKRVLMLPVSTLLEILPRMVRELARDQEKEIDLSIQGADIEVDKRILEELKDPLIHLVRNAVDHGIEVPQERTTQGKGAKGQITLTVSTVDSRTVELELRDDGRGIDEAQVRAAAVRSGHLSAEAAHAMTAAEGISLIFQSGVSSSEILTDISGRGLGLAIVQAKVEALGGVVTVESRTGMGATFRMRLPMTLSTYRGILVRTRKQLFILPTAQVERVLRMDRDEIRTVESRETIRLDGRVLALADLGDVLGIPHRVDGSPGGGRSDSSPAVGSWRDGSQPGYPQDKRYASILILAYGERRLALLVDEVVAEEEVLVKGLGKQLSRVRNIVGATILGGGTVVPVLNVADLMLSAVRPGQPRETAASPAGSTTDLPQIHHILVAEDSITSRTLLRNILETGGYRVTTAVDGMDALTQLRSGHFDLVVSDVDMPRMSGFELVMGIRRDKRLAELPVILVTALESRDDRERGIEVGANAYIVKSSFDQSNLLDVVKRLV